MIRPKHSKLEKNRIIFFQIGLIIALSVLFLLLESEKKMVTTPTNTLNNQQIPIGNVKISMFKINEDVQKPDPKKLLHAPNNQAKFSLADLSNLNMMAVAELPYFVGGEKQLKKFIRHELRYPPQAIENKEQGKVFVAFMIDTTGQVHTPRIIRSISPVLDKEALRIVANFPKWKPAANQKSDIQVIIPISFVLKNT